MHKLTEIPVQLVSVPMPDLNFCSYSGNVLQTLTISQKSLFVLPLLLQCRVERSRLLSVIIN